MTVSDGYLADIALELAIRGIRKEDFDLAKSSVQTLMSGKNAYSQANVNIQEPAPDGGQRWNMITYKSGKKSSL